MAQTNKLLGLLDRIEAKPLLEEEKAWALFRVAALSEAVGWTLLIIGLLIRHFTLPGYDIAVPIAGQFHGTIFLIYFAVLITTYTSLRWSRKKFLVAILAGVPPYGSLIFELWESRQRKNKRTVVFLSSLVLSVV